MRIDHHFDGSPGDLPERLGKLRHHFGEHRIDQQNAIRTDRSGNVAAAEIADRLGRVDGATLVAEGDADVRGTHSGRTEQKEGNQGQCAHRASHGRKGGEGIRDEYVKWGWRCQMTLAPDATRACAAPHALPDPGVRRCTDSPLAAAASRPRPPLRGELGLAPPSVSGKWALYWASSARSLSDRTMAATSNFLPRACIERAHTDGHL